MFLNLAELESQLAHTENELELAKAHTHRCDGAIQLLKHLIQDAKKETKEPKV